MAVGGGSELRDTPTVFARDAAVMAVGTITQLTQHRRCNDNEEAPATAVTTTF